MSTKLRRVVFALALFHIAIIGISNYLVQLPFVIFGMHTTWGAFSFPFIFLATDLTVRILGARSARKIVLLAMFPAFILSYLLGALFYEGQFTGLEKLFHWQPVLLRIAIASFVAYLVGQLLDVIVFNRLRNMKAWWPAPTASTVLGNLIDTLLFFSIAFYASSNPFMAAHWMEIAWADYGFKLTISFLFFLPSYGMLINLLLRKLKQFNTDFTLEPQQAN